MLIRPIRTIALLAVGLILASPLLANHSATTHSPALQQQPEFPVSELRKGHEGWVIVTYGIDDDGSVVDARVTDSSGSLAFEKAALDAVNKWQFEPGATRMTSVQIQFVYERPRPHVSKSFYRKLRKVHEAIELGELDAASEAIHAIRRSKSRSRSLGATENAYLLIAEGRLAEYLGDQERQLAHFRMAALGEGRWVGRRYYLRLLHDITVLELSLGDYGSAFAHYDELNRTGTGRKLAANLDGAIAAVPPQVLTPSDDVAGFLAADAVVDVVREFPQTRISNSRMQGAGDDGFRPRPAPASRPSDSGGR